MPTRRVSDEGKRRPHTRAAAWRGRRIVDQASSTARPNDKIQFAGDREGRRLTSISSGDAARTVPRRMWGRLSFAVDLLERRYRAGTGRRGSRGSHAPGDGGEIEQPTTRIGAAAGLDLLEVPRSTSSSRLPARRTSSGDEGADSQDTSTRRRTKSATPVGAEAEALEHFLGVVSPRDDRAHACSATARGRARCIASPRLVVTVPRPRRRWCRNASQLEGQAGAPRPRRAAGGLVLVGARSKRARPMASSSPWKNASARRSSPGPPPDRGPRAPPRTPGPSTCREAHGRVDRVLRRRPAPCGRGRPRRAGPRRSTAASGALASTSRRRGPPRPGSPRGGDPPGDGLHSASSRSATWRGRTRRDHRPATRVDSGNCGRSRRTSSRGRPAVRVDRDRSDTLGSKDSDDFSRQEPFVGNMNYDTTEDTSQRASSMASSKSSAADRRRPRTPPAAASTMASSMRSIAVEPGAGLDLRHAAARRPAGATSRRTPPSGAFIASRRGGRGHLRRTAEACGRRGTQVHAHVDGGRPDPPAVEVR